MFYIKALPAIRIFYLCLVMIGLGFHLIPAKEKAMQVYEHTSKTIVITEGDLQSDVPRLSLDVLTGQLGFTLKELPGDQTGICYGDLCIPMETGEAPDEIRMVNGQRMVPMTTLYESLQGDLIRDLDGRWLLLNTDPAGGDNDLPSEAVDFMLPDMNGKTVELSDYRGQKVILFAWASW